MTDNRVHDIMLKLTNLFLKDSNIIFAILFGSHVQKKQKNSDIDVAIYFKKPPEGLKLLRLINMLSNQTGKEVDLVVLNDASAFLTHQVMKYGIPLTIKDRNIYGRFREKTITDYQEYKFVSGMNVYDR
ncbi:MAG: hypothetical protein A2Y97_07555 [Nitrospirae bacterium RBG_13_39_12]|nr:MAG: hypothetical protein A2Y97_07555 [Nitrospirae bacterium RBG_13_39_12]